MHIPMPLVEPSGFVVPTVLKVRSRRPSDAFAASLWPNNPFVLGGTIEGGVRRNLTEVAYDVPPDCLQMFVDCWLRDEHVMMAAQSAHSTWVSASPKTMRKAGEHNNNVRNVKSSVSPAELNSPKYVDGGYYHQSAAMMNSYTPAPSAHPYSPSPVVVVAPVIAPVSVVAPVAAAATSLDAHSLEALCIVMLSSGFQLREHRHLLRRHEHCFRGSDAADFMIERGLASVVLAVGRILNAMLSHGMIDALNAQAIVSSECILKFTGKKTFPSLATALRVRDSSAKLERRSSNSQDGQRSVPGSPEVAVSEKLRRLAGENAPTERRRQSVGTSGVEAVNSNNSNNNNNDVAVASGFSSSGRPAASAPQQDDEEEGEALSDDEDERKSTGQKVGLLTYVAPAPKRFAVWDDEKILYVGMDESTRWIKWDYVRVTGDVTERALSFATASDSNRLECVRNLGFEWSVKDLHLNALLPALVGAPRLRALQISRRLNSTKVLSEALCKLRRLRQLSCWLDCPKSEYSMFFRSLHSLPLRALMLDMSNTTSKQAEQLCEALSHFSGSLLWLSIVTDSDDFYSTFCKLLITCRLHHLRVLRFPQTYKVTLSQLEDLRFSLEMMPYLEDFAIAFSDSRPANAEITVLARFFSVTFRSITRLQLTFNHVSDKSVRNLFMQLASNTRLRSLTFMSAYDLRRDLVASGLLSAGWLVELEYLYGLHDDIKIELSRNMERHAACQRTCIALIAMRKLRRAVLPNVANDLVILIAKQLYEMRNDKLWDRK